jgi:membrane-bound serine protease (ClpP class)
MMKSSIKQIFNTLGFILALTFTSSVFAEQTNVYEINKILKFNIDSSINPATLNYLEHNIKKHSDADAYFIQMNTPGGLLSTTKEIMILLSSSEKPSIIWVGPSGASATSAGAIIASSSHLLYMSPGTNIGAATPISTQGDLKDKSDLRAKAINDIRALVRSQAELHGKNAKPFEDMITKAASFSAEESKKLKIIDGVEATFEDVLKSAEAKVIKLNGQDVELAISPRPTVTEAVMDIGQKLLNILSSPNLAYILFLAGAALLYVEFQAPGGFIAGSIGAVCLVLAGIGFQVLPLNMGALALICLGFVLFILEIYITSFGILSIAATACLIAGSMFLYRTDDSYLSVSFSVIMSVVAALLTFMGIVFFVFLKSRKNVGAHKFNDDNLKFGEIVEILEPGKYMIKSHGEFWKSIGPQDLVIGDKVEVVCKNRDLTLEISKIEG